MSFKTYTARNNNKAKKGISPVIATVILVAVAVVIAAALAGFSSSLFGTYSSAGGSVKVETMTVKASDGTASITLNNSGNTNDDLLAVEAVGNTPVTSSSSPSGITTTDATHAIEPGQTQTYTTLSLGTFVQGQTITVKMSFQSGTVLTQSVVVSA